MRRIALFSDIHANSLALDAVLADIDSAGLEEVYCLGDLVGYGPDPSGAVERIRILGIPTIRGNYDEGIGTRRGDCGCYYATEQAKSDGAASYAFTDAALDDADHEWLATLPTEFRLEHEGARILLAHGSPRKINEYLLLDRKDAQLARLAEQAAADVVCVGHIHIPYHRVLTADDGRAIHYVSSGSVGKPKDGDPRAGWVELVLGTKAEVNATCSEDHAAGPVGAPGGERVWLGTTVHRVPYDVEQVAEVVVAAGLPPTLAEALRAG
ncbi:MAG: metallophosphoesterase family protein [Coriobacteriia bacterium]|nr:metallophosphoesterase family protein [Actinomycetota bacterium]MDZ4167164.1 metallophosphoesterase family protein [Coriobacteriia bacterium]